MGKFKQAQEQAAEDAERHLEAIDLQLETLRGDIRDALLTQVRSMSDPWQKLSESAQQTRIMTIDNMAGELVRRAAHIIGSKGFDHIGITIGKFTSKDGEIKAEFTTSQTHDSLVKIADMQNRRSLLVLVDADMYNGEQAPAEPDKDQPDLPIAEAAE